MGYVSGVAAVLLINLIIAYSVFLPAAAGLLNLGAAGFVLIGAYSAGALTTMLGWPLGPAVIVAGLFSAAIAFVLAFPILRTRGVYMILATYAFAEVVGGICLNIPSLGGAAGLSVTTYAGLPFVVPAAICVTIFVAWLLSTRLGLAMRAVHDDENVALLFGVNLRTVQVTAFTAGGALGGIGGALLVHQFNFIDVQTTGVLFSIYVLLYVLIGGTQTAWGPVAGAVFFTVVPEALRMAAKLSPSMNFLEAGRFIVFGIAVVLIMVVRPEGMITRTLVEKGRRSFRRREGDAA